MHEILREVIQATMNQIRQKESTTAKEKEDDKFAENIVDIESDSSEDEKPSYNPKNVPTGWDGK